MLNTAGLVDHSFTPKFSVTPSAAWSFFRTGLTQQQRQLMVDRAFLDFLTQVTKDNNDPASPFAGQFGRAYQAIATLFPAGFGYTDNADGGGAVGSSSPYGRQAASCGIPPSSDCANGSLLPT